MEQYRPVAIADLVKERQEIATNIAQLNSRLESLDKQLFSRLEAALAAFGIDGPSIPRQESLNIPPAPSANVSVNVNPKSTMFMGAAAPLPPLPPGSKSQKKRSKIGIQVEEHAVRRIREANRPIRTRDLLASLTSEGVVVPGKDQANNLSAHLSRSLKLVSTNSGWWLVEKTKPNLEIG